MTPKPITPNEINARAFHYLFSAFDDPMKAAKFYQATRNDATGALRGALDDAFKASEHYERLEAVYETVQELGPDGLVLLKELYGSVSEPAVDNTPQSDEPSGDKPVKKREPYGGKTARKSAAKPEKTKEPYKSRVGKSAEKSKDNDDIYGIDEFANEFDLDRDTVRRLIQGKTLLIKGDGAIDGRSVIKYRNMMENSEYYRQCVDEIAKAANTNRVYASMRAYELAEKDLLTNIGGKGNRAVYVFDTSRKGEIIEALSPKRLKSESESHASTAKKAAPKPPAEKPAAPKAPQAAAPTAGSKSTGLTGNRPSLLNLDGLKADGKTAYRDTLVALGLVMRPDGKAKTYVYRKADEPIIKDSLDLAMVSVERVASACKENGKDLREKLEDMDIDIDKVQIGGEDVDSIALRDASRVLEKYRVA